MKFYNYLICVVLLLSVSCSGGESSVEGSRKVRCERVEIDRSSSQQAIFPGRVVAATDVNIGFRVPGIVDEICVIDGSFVSEGGVVARLDSRDYALQLAATQAEYDAVKGEVDRVVALYADRSISANDYDKATNTLRAITAKLEAHRNALSDTELRAPFDCYVQRRFFDRGEAVAAGTPVVALISAAAPEITIDIPAAYYIREGSFEGASAVIDIYGDRRFDLALKSISPKANLNQLYRVTFTLDGVDGVIPSAGVSAMVEMSYSTTDEPNVIVPFTAIVEREGQSSVWVVDDGVVSSRGVEVVEIKSSGRAYVKGGLNGGEMVVVAGVNSLREGMEVSLLKGSSASNIGGLK